MMFPVKRSGVVAAAGLAGCVTITGPCSVTTHETADGTRDAEVECDLAGAVTVLAPVRTIEAVEGRAASGAAP